MTFFKRYQNSLIQYVKYCIVGISCAAIDLVVLNGLMYLFPAQQTVRLLLYNSIAYTLAVLNSYIWNSKFTFKAKKNTRQFIAFIIQALFSLFIANVVFAFGLWLFGQVLVLPKWIRENAAKLISMFLSSTASFFFNKFIVFKRKSILQGTGKEK